MSPTSTDEPLARPRDGADRPTSEPITLRLDTRGMSCPLPIVRTTQAMATLAPGQLLEVIAYSAKSVGEYRAWSKSTGHSLVDSSTEGGVYRFVLRKK